MQAADITLATATTTMSILVEQEVRFVNEAESEKVHGDKDFTSF